MKISFIAVGSRGDVQPYVALGLGLRRAGHAVRIAAGEDFRDFVTGHGLDFAPLIGNLQSRLNGELGRAWLASGRNFIAFVRHLHQFVEPIAGRFFAECEAACEGAEAIVCSLLGFPGYHIAERMGVPCFMTGLQPIGATRAHPHISAPQLSLGAPYNLLTHLVLGQLTILPFMGPVNRWRQETLHLPKISFPGPGPHVYRRRIPYLFGYSPEVVPKPCDWPVWYHVTGYWFLSEEAWRPPADLVSFLDAGPPPVYVGLGSMSPRDPAAFTALALGALRAAGQRGVLLSGWGGLGQSDLPDDVFLVHDVPHDWLFPRMAAVVHHGGAGTTAAALRAGVPAVVTPFFADQFFWAHRLAMLGAGPKPVNQKSLTLDRLAAAIRIATSDPAVRARAAAVGERIRAEDGVGRAVALFHQYL